MSVHKRPASQMAPQPVHTTSLSLCMCGSSWRLSKHHVIAATCYDLIGAKEVMVETKRCNSCSMIYGPNFRNRSGELTNTSKISDMAMDTVLFVNTKVGFTIRFLKYHSFQFFRCCSTGRGVEWAFEKTFFDNPQKHDAPKLHYGFRKLYYDALFYYMVALEWEILGKHMSVVIGKELDEKILDEYDTHCHEYLLPPAHPKKVTALVGDGHQKVLMKTCGAIGNASKKRAGRPRQDGHEKRSHGHGWFMLIDPVSARILSVVPQDQPEGNTVATHSLLKVLPKYPKVDLLIMDRCCHFMPAALKTEGLEQLKYFSLDRFHSYGHTRKCPCNPRSKTRLKKRIAGLNTSVAEQTFSWFRGYSRVLNDMRRARHRFAVLLFCKWHNNMVLQGNTHHLNKYKVQKAKNASKPYACNKKTGKGGKKLKTMKVRKNMKAMKWGRGRPTVLNVSSSVQIVVSGCCCVQCHVLGVGGWKLV